MIELKRKIQQLEKEVEGIKAQVNKSPLRIEPPSLPLASQIRWVQAIEDMPKDTKFKAKLFDKNTGVLTDEEIDVHCTLISLSYALLDDNAPFVLNGDGPIPVIQMNYDNEGTVEKRWHCLWWWGCATVCPC